MGSVTTENYSYLRFVTDLIQTACTVIQRAVHIHPAVSELIPTMLGSLKAL